MAGFILKQTAASAPPVDEGATYAVFEAFRLTEHEDWAGKENKFGKIDNGLRWAFDYAILDENLAPLYDTREEYEGDPIVLSPETNRTVGENSNAYKHLKGILNAAELASLASDDGYDIEDAYGRIVQLVIVKSDKGWPNVDSVSPVPKAVQAQYAKLAK